jgi:TolB protein
MKDWDGPPPAVFLVDLAAKTARRLTVKGLFAWQPEWLDTANFLCILQRQGDKGPSVVRMPLAGGDPTVLVGNARQPSISAAP